MWTFKTEHHHRGLMAKSKLQNKELKINRIHTYWYFKSAYLGWGNGSVECLPLKHEDLSSNPQYLLKSQLQWYKPGILLLTEKWAQSRVDL